MEALQRKIWSKTVFKNIPTVMHGEYSVSFQKEFAQDMLERMNVI